MKNTDQNCVRRPQNTSNSLSNANATQNMHKKIQGTIPYECRKIERKNENKTTTKTWKWK